jgi:hypothetical protein
MTTEEVGNRLIELCKQGQNIEAIDQLYGEHVVNLEAMAMGPEFPQRSEGKQEVRDQNLKWMEYHEIHGGTVDGPFFNGEKFAAIFTMDVTAKGGPMAGQRMQGTEVGLYHVEGGQIVKIEWFYDTTQGG